MRRIIARDDHPLLSAIGRDFEIMMLPHPVMIGHADFLILIQPSIGEILNEAEMLEGMNTHIIVFTEPYREMLLKALFRRKSASRKTRSGLLLKCLSAYAIRNFRRGLE